MESAIPFRLSRAMRDRLYLVGFLLVAGALLYLGRKQLAESTLIAWGLTFGGMTAAAVLGMTLYRVQFELRASRHELARKEAELNFALEVQRSLFPRQFPQAGRLEFAAACVPARGVSGDYYDVLELPDGRLVFAIADVSGKGISAAILMSNVHAALRILAAAGHSLSEICTQLNSHLYDVTESARFITFFSAQWDPTQGRLQYVNAGHNPPLLLRSAGERRLKATSPPLGLLLDSAFPERDVTLEPGDLLALYSDGITEAGIERGQPFGETQLKAVATAHREKPIAEILRQVLRAAREWAGSEPEDDMTLLLVRATGPAKEEV
jgi:sigma-B regulation protein RsbU (phosphoserine phosphatase)